MADPLMPPNRRGSGKSGVNREESAPQAQPQPNALPAAQQPQSAPKPAPARPAPQVARPAPQPQQPAAQQPIPQAMPVYPQQVQMPTVQVAIPVAQPYVAPQAYPAPQAYAVPQAYAAPAPVAQPAVARPAVAQLAPQPAPVVARAVGPAPVQAQAAQRPGAEESPEEFAQHMWQLQGVLGGTRPWLWLLGVIFFVDGAGFIGVLGYTLYKTGGGLSKEGVAAQLGAMFTATVLMISSMFLFGYAKKIGEFLLDPTRYWLESSLAAQRSVWRFLAILNLFSLLLGITIFIAVLVGTAMFLSRP